MRLLTLLLILTVLTVNSYAETFGKTTSGQNIESNQPKHVTTRFYMPQRGNVHSMAILFGNNITDNPLVFGAVYSDLSSKTGNTPGKLLGYTQIGFGLYSGWNTFNMASTLTLSPGYYWLDIVIYKGIIDLAYDEIGNTVLSLNNTNSLTPPMTIFQSGVFLQREYSVYANYTPLP